MIRRVEKSAARQVAERWVELNAQLEAASVLTSGVPRLADYALGEFRPQAVLQRLLDLKPSYFAQKDILFAGLCAWTVCPRDPNLVQEAMILAGAACLAGAEREYQKAFPQSPMLADIVTRLNGPGIDFYRDFYYPAGGLQRILVARSPATLKKEIQAASQWIELSVEMTRVCHFHADKLEDRSKFLRASYASAGSAVSYLIGEGKRDKIVVNSLLAARLTNKTVDALNCQKRSNEFSRSAALIYAAYSIAYASENLLTVICRGEASYQKHGHLIVEWARRAAYVAEHIISPMYKRAGKLEQIEYLSDIAPLAFTGPDYGKAIEGVKRAFAVMRPRSVDLPDDLQGPRKPQRKVCWS